MSATSGTEVPLQGNPRALAADAEAFGEFLRARRQRAGISLDQITNETKIPQRHFEALEQGSVRTWPRGMYTRAMLRAYAESVGLDREYVAAQFERVFEQKTPEAAAPAVPAPEIPPVTPAPVVAVAARRRLAPMAGVAVATIALVAAGAMFVSRDGAVATATTPPTAVTVPRPAATPRVDRPAAHAPTPATPAPSPAVTPTPARLADEPPAARAAAPAATASATDGELIVTSEPSGARVMVNGVGWGSTPARIKYLPLGPKRIRVTKDGFLSAERSVTLQPHTGSLKVQITLQSRK